MRRGGGVRDVRRGLDRGRGERAAGEHRGRREGEAPHRGGHELRGVGD